MMMVDIETARAVSLLEVAKSLGCALVAQFEDGRLIGWKFEKETQMQKGTYAGKFMGHAWGDNEKSGNPFVSMTFMVIGGPDAGRVIKKTQAITAKTVSYVKDAYIAIGWSGQGELPDLTADQLKKLCLLDVDESEFTRDDGTKGGGFEVTFVRPVASVKKPISDANRARVSALVKGAPPPDSDGYDGELPHDMAAHHEGAQA